MKLLGSVQRLETWHMAAPLLLLDPRQTHCRLHSSSHPYLP